MGLRVVLIWMGTTAILFLGFVPHWGPPLLAWFTENDKLAGWAQAVGAVVAIFASAALVYLQHHLENARQARSEHQAMIVRMRIVLEVARTTASHARGLKRALSSRTAVHDIAEGRAYFAPDMLHSLPTAVAQIPLHQLDSPVMVFELRTIVSATQQMRANATNLLRSHRRITGEDFASAFKSFDDAVAACDESVEQMRAHIERVERGASALMDRPRGQ